MKNYDSLPHLNNSHLSNICPLCTKIQSSAYYCDHKRDYLHCDVCQLVYVPAEFHLTAAQEKKQYDFHTNNPADQNYRQFLSRLFIPLSNQLLAGSTGLDFGSGPGPTLSVMFEEVGFSMFIYDKFYAKNDSVFENNYDFITATEVIEHLKNPAQEIKRLLSKIKTGGYLGIMTKLIDNSLLEQSLIEKQERFKNWHYKNDLTHICFYSQETFFWIARQYQLSVEFIGADVIILKK
ncbi:MAG: class I SAM-dependent methyltransferase [Pseudomonadota bacterium]